MFKEFKKEQRSGDQRLSLLPERHSGKSYAMFRMLCRAESGIGPPEPGNGY